MTAIPKWDRVSHISFSARDKVECADWFERVMGFEYLDRVQGDERFDPRRTGFDHLGWKVESREVLQDWQAHFDHLGVDYTPTVDGEYGSVLTFRDPDGRQFEMFFTPEHP